MLVKQFYTYHDADFDLSHSLTYSPDQANFRLHTHQKAELYYFVSGSGIFHIEGSAYQLKPGDMLLMQPAESHYIELDTTQPYERIVLHFNMEALTQVDPGRHLLKPLLDREPGKQNRFLPQQFRGGSCEHYFRTMMNPEPECRVSVLAGVIPLLYELCAIQSSAGQELPTQADTVEYRILRYLNQNIDKPVTLEDVCREFYISKSQLCRVFRNCTGVTVKQYLMAKRLVRAKQLLEAGMLPTHVYSRCGFSEYSSFYRAYVKFFGISPGKK
jgi:AraC-like DNA-binding protein/quercetin dioxygenase-like cupin family protein